MKRTAKAQWEGSLQEGKGSLTTQSKTLNKTNYTFKKRFIEGEEGTNPEELIAVAHAGCFTMAVAAALTKQGLEASSLYTKATLSMKEMAISGMRLSISGTVPGMHADAFKALVETAKNDCMVSKILNIPIMAESFFIDENATATTNESA
jgi:osmotically inducible protein OsmC